MRIVLGKAAHPHQPVQGTRGLVAVAGTKLRQTQRQVLVALQALVEDLNMARTVHRLDGVVVLLRLGGEHVVVELVPVTGLLPQRPRHHLRGFDFLVAVHMQLVAHVLLDFLVQRPAVRVPEHHTRRFLLHVEQVKFLANLAMVALFRLFQTVQVRLQILFIAPGGTVHALKLLIAGVATPIGTGDLGQLERFQLTGARYVRAAAQVNEVALAVERQVLFSGNVLDNADLIFLAHLIKQFDRLVAGQH